MVTQQTEGDLTTKIFDNFLNEVYEPEQIQVKNRLGNLENNLDVVETLHTEILKNKNLEGEIRALKSYWHPTNPKVVSDDKHFKDLEDKTRSLELKVAENITNNVNLTKRLTKLEQKVEGEKP